MARRSQLALAERLLSPNFGGIQSVEVVILPRRNPQTSILEHILPPPRFRIVKNTGQPWPTTCGKTESYGLFLGVTCRTEQTCSPVLVCLVRGQIKQAGQGLRRHLVQFCTLSLTRQFVVVFVASFTGSMIQLDQPCVGWDPLGKFSKLRCGVVLLVCSFLFDSRCGIWFGFVVVVLVEITPAFVASAFAVSLFRGPIHPCNAVETQEQEENSGRASPLLSFFRSLS